MANSNYDFYVITIGSSAGGFEPLKTIVSNLPEDLPAAIVVVQHIPTGAPSNLGHILQPLTSLKVVAVETIEYLEPGHIYVMAAGQQLKLQDHFISVERRSPLDKVNRTIDRCFMSMAEEVGEKAIGIILSGAGYDGLEGARAIEKKDGLMIVQDPETAQFPLMPQTLIANDHPDYVLKPEDISCKLMEKLAA